MAENYRPLKMLHGYDFGGAGNDIAAKKRIIEKRIDDLHEKGYGGIVTNVDMDRNYLRMRKAGSYSGTRCNMPRGNTI